MRMDTAWMASLYDGANIFRCGGTLITRRFVLTAAHCKGDYINDPFWIRFVRLGEKDRSCKTCPNVQEFTVGQFIAHPRHRRSFLPSDTSDNDIALIRLSGIVEYTDFVRPICIIIDDALHFPRDINVSVFGWGKTTPYSDINNQINTISMKRQSLSYCSHIFNMTLSDKQLCAKALNDGSTCAGDSGGPLGADYTYQGKTSYVQIGIMSFGSDKCRNAGVYTNLESHQTWIVNTVQINSGLLFEECGRYIPDEITVRFWEWPQRSIPGTLITDRYVLTVASDLPLDITKITVRSRYSDIAVVKIDKHPDFSPYSKRNNIALLGLAQVTYPALWIPICLEVNSNPSKTFTAFLHTHNRSLLSQHIQQLAHIEASLCSKKIEMSVEPNQVCIENRNNFIYGLPGSVLGTYKEANGVKRYFLAGIISHIKSEVIVFIKIHNFVDWISKKVAVDPVESNREYGVDNQLELNKNPTESDESYF